MLDIRLPHQEPMSPLEINRTQLGVHDPTIPHHTYMHLQVLWRMRDRREQVYVFRQAMLAPAPLLPPASAPPMRMPRCGA